MAIAGRGQSTGRASWSVAFFTEQASPWPPASFAVIQWPLFRPSLGDVDVMDRPLLCLLLRLLEHSPLPQLSSQWTPQSPLPLAPKVGPLGTGLSTVLAPHSPRSDFTQTTVLILSVPKASPAQTSFLHSGPLTQLRVDPLSWAPTGTAPAWPHPGCSCCGFPNAQTTASSHRFPQPCP